ncbi:helix-turn-helix domain-containing protein [Aurantiacibacter spongiae]|uniref:MarR family transcriptional regulator n=1 Tax=Aurantiacibacter spongiae TaxID=2488860 RepID=A0A3N5DJI3_9SPHN|nr:winged helix DNA-binding protein [Aurantiacibacter spongiae]RPF70855.1 MarR family transcriptional regulator [Aurantiacibacter spongiae]
MSAADFSYGMAADSAGLPLSVSIYADRDPVLDEMREDVEQAGFDLREIGPLAMLLDDHARPLGELVVIDCQTLDGHGMAALSRLDMRVAHAGARLIVATSIDMLDTVFGCCLESDPQIIVDPRRADRVIALGRALADRPIRRVRELDEDDRLTLLRLTEQVASIAQRLDRFGTTAGRGADGGAFRFESPKTGYRAQGDGHVRKSRPPLPEPALVRQIIAQRRARTRFFDEDLFADPAWDMLLDLTAARAEHARVSVTSLCIASGVPPTTALRWIGQMTQAGLFDRVEDDTDRRRAFIRLSDSAADAMARYFAAVGAAAPAMA